MADQHVSTELKHARWPSFCLSMIFSENRCPSRITSGTGFFSDHALAPNVIAGKIGDRPERPVADEARAMRADGLSLLQITATIGLRSANPLPFSMQSAS